MRTKRRQQKKRQKQQQLKEKEQKRARLELEEELRQKLLLRQRLLKGQDNCKTNRRPSDTDECHASATARSERPRRPTSPGPSMHSAAKAAQQSHSSSNTKISSRHSRTSTGSKRERLATTIRRALRVEGSIPSKWYAQKQCVPSFVESLTLFNVVTNGKKFIRSYDELGECMGYLFGRHYPRPAIINGCAGFNIRFRRLGDSRRTEPVSEAFVLGLLDLDEARKYILYPDNCVVPMNPRPIAPPSIVELLIIFQASKGVLTWARAMRSLGHDMKDEKLQERIEVAAEAQQRAREERVQRTGDMIDEDEKKLDHPWHSWYWGGENEDFYDEDYYDEEDVDYEEDETIHEEGEDYFINAFNNGGPGAAVAAAAAVGKNNEYKTER